MSTNEQIRDLLIAHEHNVQRFSEYEIRKLNTILNKAQRELKAKLLVADIPKWTKQRYETMLKGLKDIQKAYNGQIEGVLNQDLKTFSGIEARAMKSAVNEVAGDVIKLSPFVFTLPSPDQLFAAARKAPMLLDDKFATMYDTMIKSIGNNGVYAIESSLRYSFAVGETIPEATRRMFGTATRKGVYEITRTRATEVTRTLINHMSSTTRREVNNQNQDIVKGFQVVATLDTRTSPICRYYDGRVWFFNEADRMSSSQRLLAKEEYPPYHRNCRTTTIPVTRSWKELGIDLKDIPPGERASMNGTVPTKQTYYEWLSNQSAERQKEVLGVTRYNLWKEGKVKPYQFHTQNGEFINLDQLEQKTGIKIKSSK